MKETKEIKAIWEQQPDDFPVFLKENPDLFQKTDKRQKKENETLVMEFSKRIQKKLRQRPPKSRDDKQLEFELEQDFTDFLGEEKIICLSEWMNPELIDAVKQETKSFIYKVRGFDETLNQAQIWQTLRNYFIYALIVEMQGEEQNTKDPILAYSLLYPYTDNYIDDKQISPQEKERFNRVIALKLKNEAVTPENSLEEKTCFLLDMILNYYEGKQQSKIAETLLQLLEAQKQSICQQQAKIREEEILEISIRKGGTSVLADYLFSTSDWLEDEEQFYLKFGFILQLVDDLQDIREDRECGSHTLMTKAEEQKKLEQYVNQLLWFSWNMIRGFQPENPTIKGFVLKNCVLITLLAAAMNQQFFTTKYLKALEPYLPFSLEFLKKKKPVKTR